MWGVVDYIKVDCKAVTASEDRIWGNLNKINDFEGIKVMFLN